MEHVPGQAGGAAAVELPQEHPAGLVVQPQPAQLAGLRPGLQNAPGLPGEIGPQAGAFVKALGQVLEKVREVRQHPDIHRIRQGAQGGQQGLRAQIVARRGQAAVALQQAV